MSPKLDGYERHMQKMAMEIIDQFKYSLSLDDGDIKALSGSIVLALKKAGEFRLKEAIKIIETVNRAQFEEYDSYDDEGLIVALITAIRRLGEDEPPKAEGFYGGAHEV